MAVDEEISDIRPQYLRRGKDPIEPISDDAADVDYLAQVIVLILRGKRPNDISHELQIPYTHAASLYKQLFEQAWKRVRDRFSPDILEEMKEDLSETLLEEIRNCRTAVSLSFQPDSKGYIKPNTRPYVAMNGAIKLVNSMHGLNAPTASIVFDGKDFAAMNSEVQVRLFKNPRTRAALLMLEEEAGEIKRQMGLDDGPVIDVTPDDEGGDG